MKIKRLLLFILILFFYSSCKKESLCLNEKFLIEPSKNDVVIKLNYNQSEGKLISDIENLFTEETCWEEKSIGLKLKNQLLKTVFPKTCPDGIIICGRNSEIKILMNENDDLLINSELMNIDTIDNWIANNLKNDIEHDISDVFFLWDSKSSKEKIELVFQKISTGYLKACETISLKKFDKEICNLNLKERNELKKNFELRIKLGFRRINYPPPIPSEIDIATKDTLSE